MAVTDVRGDPGQGPEGTWVSIEVRSRYKVDWVKVRCWVIWLVLGLATLLGLTHIPAGRLLAMLSGG
jgi:hypothetical protein